MIVYSEILKSVNKEKFMNNNNFDIAIAIIFFVRSDTLKKVFDAVKKIKPSTLFLIQDGPRKGNQQDLINIKKCRDIVEDINWECKVLKNYSDTNLGCGRRPYTGVSWVFEHVDKAIILEDDCVPSLSFFRFSKEMLLKYENDMRIGIVSGLNHFDNFNFDGCSYGFSKAAGIWGWATWKNRWDMYKEEDFELIKFDNQYLRELVYKDITPRFAAKYRLKIWKSARQSFKKNGKVSFWDYQWSYIRYINSWLSIVPSKNLISNIGIGYGNTHSANHIKLLPKKKRMFFFKNLYNLSFPLKHPNYVLVNRNYDKKYYKIVSPNLFVRIYWKIILTIKKKSVNVLDNISNFFKSILNYNKKD